MTSSQDNISEPTGPETMGPTPSPWEVPSESATILTVDDDPHMRAFLKRLLRAEGMEVISAGDGREGLKVFDEQHPDLVLLDVMMPFVDGFEVCRQLKSNPDSVLTPVVMLTGLSEATDRVRGIEAGADDFVSKPVDRVELLARVRSLLRVKRYTDELERAEEVLFALARSIEGKDPYTEGHCERLSEYASELGRRLGLPADQVTALRRAGMVHDIGKVAVPDAILLKDGPLTPEEWEVMREHPVSGDRICRGLKSFAAVIPIIRHHHEKGDGGGYPDGLKGDEIPLTARVLQVVDVYDALTTKRPYREAFSSEKALEVIDSEVAKGWWDASLVASFKEMLDDGVMATTV